MEGKSTRTMKMEKEPPKIFNDPVHGHIEMPPLLVKIIDTPEFQRLRNIKQLGGGYYVFPGASHNRFEHSIGVAHLAGQMVKSLRDRQGLEITEQDELCVQIAGLCHDLGHGPFSHAFETFIKEVKDPGWKHEQLSVKMFEKIIEKAHIKERMTEEGLTKKHITLIKDLIQPSQNIPQEYLYQIVSNPRTGIDVDKMDYFIRDCHHLGMKCNFSHERYMKFARVYTDVHGEKQICMRDKEAINMYELFHVRNLLHHNAYQHRVTKAVELMIVDALKEAEKTFQISAQVDDPQKYVTLTDDVLQQIQHSAEPELKTARKIIDRISERKFYRFIGVKIFETDELKHLDDKKEKFRELLQAWLKYVKEKDGSQTLNPKDFDVKPISFSYGMKEKNPIDAQLFYRKDVPDKPIQISKDEVSYILPEKFAEIKVMVFYKGENTDVENLTKKHIKEFWNYLDPVFALANNPRIHMDLSVVKPDLLQQFRHSTEEKTERFLKQGSYKIIAEKIFKDEELKHLDNAEQWKDKVETWLKSVQKTGGNQPNFTGDDFKVVQYSLRDKPNSKKVLLLYKGLAKEDTEKFWQEVLKDLKDMKLISNLVKKTITYVDLIDGKPLGIICLLILAGHGIIEKLLKQGFFIFEEKIFKAEHLKHLQSDDQWKEKLKAGLKNIQKQAGGKQPPPNAADFKVVSYPLPGQPDFVNVMLFCKGLHKEETEIFWGKV